MLDPEELTLASGYIAPNDTFLAIEPLHLGFVNLSFQVLASRPDAIHYVFIVQGYSYEHQKVFGQDETTLARTGHAVLSLLPYKGML